MAKLNCPCGHVFSDVSESEWRSFASFLVTPALMDELCSAEQPKDDETDVDCPEVWKCPKCGRLAIDKAAGSVEVTFYVPETEPTARGERQN